jgi:hypothetical protein
MAYKLAYVLIEGPDDERFLDRVINPILRTEYDFVKPYMYAGKPKRTIKNFLKSIKAMNAAYFFLADINRSPCVTAKKEDITRRYKKTIDSDNIMIVVKEIEGWYLAGLGDGSCQEVGLEPFTNTDEITKEKFNQLIPNKFGSRIDFMLEVLDRFDVETGKRKNKSFNYFMTKI